MSKVPESLRKLASLENHKLTRSDGRLLLLAAELIEVAGGRAEVAMSREADAHKDAISSGALVSVARSELRGLLELLDQNAR